MENYGTLIKKIRIEKGLTQKDIYSDIMTRQTYYLIESNISMPSFDKFLLILEKLFLSVDEFLSLLDPTCYPSEKKLYRELSTVIFSKNKNALSALITRTSELYEKTKNKKYFHLYLIAKAMFCLHFDEQTVETSERITELMTPIKEYILGIETWHLYELKLLNNSLYCFTLEEAVALVTLISKKMNSLEQTDEHQDVKLRIYLNLSFLCLNHKEYENTLKFSSLAKTNAEINYRLFERIIAELNYEIAKSALSKEKKLTLKAKEIFRLLKMMNFNETGREYEELLKNIHLS